MQIRPVAVNQRSNNFDLTYVHRNSNSRHLISRHPSTLLWLQISPATVLAADVAPDLVAVAVNLPGDLDLKIPKKEKSKHSSKFGSGIAHGCLDKHDEATPSSPSLAHSNEQSQSQPCYNVCVCVPFDPPGLVVALVHLHRNRSVGVGVGQHPAESKKKAKKNNRGIHDKAESKLKEETSKTERLGKVSRKGK